MRTNRSNAPGHASRRAGAFALILLAALASADLAMAQDGSCVDLCSSSCIKPWSIPDRWDDVTGIPGYMGEAVSGRIRRPDWRNNLQWNCEPFIDANGSRLWEPGESYTDGNANGAYDAEAYHPSLTGYGPDPVAGNFLSPAGDIGLELVLHPSAGGSATPEPGQYYAIDLPPVNKGTPITGADEYRNNIENCNAVQVEPGDWLQLDPGSMPGPTSQGMDMLIAQDPDAYWDDATQSVANSNFESSQRVVFLTAHDPRIPVVSGTNTVQVTSVIAFFMERKTGQSEVRGRLLRVQLPVGALGAACAPGQSGGFIVDCPVPAAAATWGRMKANYR